MSNNYLPTLQLDIDPLQLVKENVKLTSLPTIVFKIDKAINSPYTTNHDIAKIISGDPDLAARILRISNSAFLGYPTRIETVSQAVSVVGTQQLRDLIFASTVTTLFKKIPENTLTMESFWQHSIACGIVARLLAEVASYKNTERFFVTGLLHDIGRLLLLIAMPDVMQIVFKISELEERCLFDVEEEVMGFNHALVGGLLLREWQLPNRLCDAVCYHHAPNQAGQHRVDASLIHVSDIIVTGIGYGSSGEKYVPPLDDDVWQALSLSHLSLSELLETLDHQFKEAVSFVLDID